MPLVFIPALNNNFFTCSIKEIWQVKGKIMFIVACEVYGPIDFQKLCELVIYIKDIISEIVTI